MSTMIEKAEAKGKTEGKADTLLKILREKFKGVPKEIETAIRQMTDPIALDSWAVQAAISQSLDEFAEALK